MQTSIPKTFYEGMLLYAAILVLATVPLFPSPLAMHELAELTAAAAIATGVVWVLLITGLTARIKDPGACFTQALLGIGICTVLYTYIGGDVLPLVMDVSILWIAIGVAHLGMRRTLALQIAYVTAFVIAAAPDIENSASPVHRDAIYALLISCVVGALLYWRARDYEYLVNEKAIQTVQLEEATEHVRTLTTYDPDTTALKRSYFIAQVLHEKVRVDTEGGTFSVGLIEIDHFDELTRSLEPTAFKQLVRKFSERATEMIRGMDRQDSWPRTFQPLGRITDGRFGLLLPGANYEAAMRCAENLHNSVEFQSIRTNAGVLGVTLSIGITEYVKNESIEQIMQMTERALTLAKSHNGNDFRGLRRVSAA